MDAKLERLIEALDLIAAPADQQIATLEEMGHFQDAFDKGMAVDPQWNIDEIALNFDDAEIFVPGLLERREIDFSQSKCVLELKDLLFQLSGPENSGFWTLDALRNDSRWSSVRNKAQECLAKLRSIGPTRKASK